MKSLTKILIAILVLTTIVPIKLSLLCLFNPQEAISFFDVPTLAAGIDKLFIVTGCYILATVAFQLYAAWLLLVGKPEGIAMAFVTGCIAIGRGVAMLFLLKAHDSNDIRVSVVPIVFGAIILSFSIVTGRNRPALQ